MELRQAEQETGVSNGYLSLLENGKAKAPSPTVLDALATKYALPFDDLMEMAGHPSGAVRAEGDASQRRPATAQAR
jgi:transcriptional regulator with XRE-family HTH domain